MSGLIATLAAHHSNSALEPLAFIFSIASNDETITIPCLNSGTFNATLDWGDNSTSDITAYNDVDLAHTYVIAGEYKVVVTGEFANIYINDNAAIDTKLTGMEGAGSSTLKTFNHSWHGCSNLSSFPALDASLVQDCVYAWFGCTQLVDFPLLNISSVELFTRAWQNCSALANFPANWFDGWDPASADRDCFLEAWDGATSLTEQSIENIFVSIAASGVSGPAPISGRYIDTDGVELLATIQANSTLMAAVTTLKTNNWRPRYKGTAL